MKFWLKAALALVAAFFVRAAFSSGFQQVVGQRMLDAAALWANRMTLFADPHPYEWPLILAPLFAMPLGAWLIVRLKPLSRNAARSAAA